LHRVFVSIAVLFIVVFLEIFYNVLYFLRVVRNFRRLLFC